jgi:hypothetical protein
VITGAYSLTQQAIHLGLVPRLEIRHTSEALFGQIYMPGVNTLLLIGVLMLVGLFRSSSALASAYGIAVSGTMVVTTMMAFVVVFKGWRWPICWRRRASRSRVKHHPDHNYLSIKPQSPPDQELRRQDPCFRRMGNWSKSRWNLPNYTGIRPSIDGT